MNSLLDDDDDDRATDDHREVTLGTGTILAIFVGLVLLCGAFFGFGYKMGSHKPVQPILAVVPESAAAPATFNNFKPAAGSPAGGSPAAIAPAATPPRPAVPQPESAAPPPEPVPHTAPVAPKPPVAQAAAPVTQTVAEGSFVVQVAAVTHPEDADFLVHALKAKHYPAFSRSEPQDKLQHVQVGPFTNRKDAEAAKQRLLADGYQPILK